MRSLLSLVYAFALVSHPALARSQEPAPGKRAAAPSTPAGGSKAAEGRGPKARPTKEPRDVGAANVQGVSNGEAIVTARGAPRGRTLADRFSDVINVRDYGAVGNGKTDDTLAIQAALEVIAQAQRTQAAAGKLIVAKLEFGPGTYLVSDRLKVHALLAITGAGNAQFGQTSIIQTAEGRNIFEFYGSLADSRSVSVDISGINFGFDTKRADGVALLFPRYDDNSPTSVLSSNSIYIRNCRFGGQYANGTFLRIDHGNDVSINDNVVDNANAPVAAVILGSLGNPHSLPVSNVVHSRNKYYQCRGALKVLNAYSLSSFGNHYFQNGSNIGWRSIDLASDEEHPRPGYVENVAITGEVFDTSPESITLDAGVRNVVVSGNVFMGSTWFPIHVTGTSRLDGGIQIAHNAFTVGDSFARNTGKAGGTLFRTDSAALANVILSENSVDLADAPEVIGLFNELRDGPALVGVSSIQGNQLVGGSRGPSDGGRVFLPLNARGLSIERVRELGAAELDRTPVFELSRISRGQWLRFDLDYSVVMTRKGADASHRMGRKRIEISYVGPQVVANIIDEGPMVDGFQRGAPEIVFEFDPARSSILMTVNSRMEPLTGATLSLRAHSFASQGVIGGKAL